MSSTTNTSSETKLMFSNCSVKAIRTKLESVLSDESLDCLLEDDETPMEVIISKSLDFILCEYGKVS